MVRVSVTAGVSREFVSEKGDGRFTVSVSPKAKKGLANARVKELLAKHFGVLPKNVVLQKGHSSSRKRFLIYGPK